MSTIEMIAQMNARAEQQKPRKVLNEAEKKQVREIRAEITSILKSGEGTDLIPLYTRAIKRIEGPLFT